MKNTRSLTQKEFNTELTACLAQGFNTWDDKKERAVTELFYSVWANLSLHLKYFYNDSNPTELIEDEIKHVSRISTLSQASLKRALKGTS